MLMLTLYRDGQADASQTPSFVQSQTEDDLSVWQYSFTMLPVVNEENEAIAYTLSIEAIWISTMNLAFFGVIRRGKYSVARRLRLASKRRFMTITTCRFITNMKPVWI